MTVAPLVSIVIPAFNPCFFASALQSALEQTHEQVEIVVCDDSCTGEIEAIVASSRAQGHTNIRYQRNPQRLGFQRNLIEAVTQATGLYLKVLCDDDRLLPRCVEQQVKVLHEHAEVSLVLAQRLLCDAGNFVLPMRLRNVRITPVDGLFNGADVLSFIDGRRINFLGNFTSALMRTSEALQWLQALTQEPHGFTALLDQALFMCLMRRGNLVVLSDFLAVERLHPQRLSKQAQTRALINAEWDMLMQMLAARTGEQAPASGWVRFVALQSAAQEPRQWQEVSLVRVLSNWQTRLLGRVGSDCESYADFYQEWLECRRFSEVQRRLMPKTIAAWPLQPRIVPVLIDEAGDTSAVQTTLDSLQGQLYPPESIVLLSPLAIAPRDRLKCLVLERNWVAQLDEVLAGLGEGDWLYLLRAGDVLNESSLLVLAERIAVLPGLQCIYSDEGAVLDGVSFEPVFKPDFNLDLMRAYPYVGRALAFDSRAVRSLGGFDSSFTELAPHDLLWRIVETAGLQAVEHIAQIQLESRLSFAQWLSLEAVVEQNAQLVSAHLQRLGVEHRIRHDEMALINRVDYLHGQRPLVSIIIAVGDDLPALQACVEGILTLTAYTHYELLLVGKGATDAATGAWLAAMAQVSGSLLRVLQAPAGSALAATGAVASAQARGEYLLFLSAASQVCAADWLDELINHAVRPEVGVVGAKVLDPSGSVIHAGRVLGAGNGAGAVMTGEAGHGRGYMQRLQVAQNWSAVSGDCLMVRKSLYDSVALENGAGLSGDLADADLCLRVGGQGYLVVWTPYSTIVRGQVSTQHTAEAELRAEQEAFYLRWLPKIARDPAYNPSLNLITVDFGLEPSLRGSWNPLCSRSLPSVLGLPINATAVGHYRVIQPFLELEAAGQVVGRISHESPTVVELARMDPDLLVLQLRHTEDAVNDTLRLKTFSNARRIFEMDDYVLEAPAKNNHARNKPKDTEAQLRRSVALCDRLVVTTQALANVMSTMHQDIRVVPNMLAAHLWTGLRSARRTSKKPRVGWGGGTSHAGDLEVIAEVVRELADEVEWVFFGMCPDTLKPYVHEYHPVIGFEVYPAKLASLNLDLALAPLEFHIFNDCKSNLRLLEYGACGYPVICSDTEAYRGYLPCTRVRTNSTAEWLEAIRMHLADPDASYRMGDALHEAVMRDYVLRDGNLQHWVRGWLAD